MKKRTIGIIVGILLLMIGGYIYLNNRTSPSELRVPKEQRKTIEAYFIDNMNASPEVAKGIAAEGVDLRVSKDATLIGIAGNLYYYSFIENEEAFTHLLEELEDTTLGQENAIKIGNNTIDINSNYYINYQMSEEEIADILLNRGKYDENFTRYNYLFMPKRPEI